MGTLNLNTVELVSTLRSAPQNGSPSSADYNDSWTESLADLAALSGFVNDVLIPMLNGLDSTVMPNPNGTPNGLEGRYVFSDTSDITPLFFDNLSSQPLSLADSLRILQGIIQTSQISINTLNVEVTALQSQLSSTNQNDISQALQNFASSLTNLTSQTVNNTQSIIDNTIALQTNGTDNNVQNELNLIAGANVTLVNSGGNVTITVPSVVIIAGADTQVQVNSAGVLYADSGFTYNKTTHNMSVSGLINTATGFTFGGAATTGHVLRGNGTEFIDAALIAADIPSIDASKITTGTISSTRLPGIVSAIQFVVDGGGSVPGTGVYGQISLPYNCTIVGWTIVADQSGSAVIDVLRSTYAGFPTTTSIAGTDKPTLSTAQKNNDFTLTGWGSTALNAGDELQISLSSVTTCNRLNLTIQVSVP